MLTYDSRSGQFALITGTTPAAGKVWQPDFQAALLSIVTAAPLQSATEFRSLAVEESPLLQPSQLLAIADEARSRWQIAGYAVSTRFSSGLPICRTDGSVLPGIKSFGSTMMRLRLAGSLIHRQQMTMNMTATAWNSSPEPIHLQRAALIC